VAPVSKQTIGQTADDVKNTPEETQRGESASSLAAHLDRLDVRSVTLMPRASLEVGLDREIPPVSESAA
jgi:hypothetical protein